MSNIINVNMTSEDNVPKKINLRSRTTPLRRSVSTTSLGVLFATHVNLRDTKSYTGGMEDAKSISSEENETSDKLGELTTNKDIYLSMKDEIETRDAITNEIVIVKTDILQQGNKKYSLNEIAYMWKKDCRIWLWKNCEEFKLNKSVGEKLKAGLIKLKECTF